VAELLRFVNEEPDTAMTLIVYARAACPLALLGRDELLDRFASCLDTQVRTELPAGEPAPSAIAVGGIEALLYSRINRGETDGIESLLPPLMHFELHGHPGSVEKDRWGRQVSGNEDRPPTDTSPHKKALWP